MSDESARHAELVLARLDALPTLSPVATRLLSVSSADDVDLNEIITLIEADPALTAKVLGLTRRAALGLGDQIKTVRHAAVMVGLEAVRAAVLSVQVYELLNDLGGEDAEEDGGTGFDRKGFWTYSIAVGCACELLARRHRSCGVDPDSAFVAGLLHGLGKLALEIALPNAYGKAVSLAERKASNLAPVERQILGLDHHRAGKKLAERWGLSEDLITSIWMHGQPAESVPESDARPMALLVTLGSAECRRLCLGWSGEFGEVLHTDSITRELGMPGDAGAKLPPALHEAVAHRAELLGLSDEGSGDLLTSSLVQANRTLSSMVRRAQAQARVGQERGATLAAVERFLSDDSGVRVGGLSSEIERVGESFAESVGAGFLAAAFRAGDTGPWSGVIFGPDGMVQEAAEVRGQVPYRGGFGLEGAIEPSSAPRWARGLVDGAPDLPSLRTTNISQPGMGAVLVHEVSPESAPLGEEGYEALARAWSWWLASAARQELAERLGEQLADANRTLAETQRQLADAQAMASLGELTAGAAHEMNNPLAVIRARSQQLAKRSLDKKDKAAAVAIVDASAKLGELIVSLHVLATPPEPKLGPCEPAELVTATIDRLKNRLPLASHGRLVVRHDPDAQAVLIDSELVSRALGEVIKNAIEAGDMSTVEVAVQFDRLRGRLEFVVRDNGCGISDEARRHAFDAFFSEKPAGRQTGLGLTRAKRFVEPMEGYIRLEQKNGGGTVATVSVEAPLAALPTTPANGSAPAGPGKNPTQMGHAA